MNTHYSFENGLLKMFDPDSGIDYEDRFIPAGIPEDLRNGLKIDETHTFKVFRFNNGSFEYSIEDNRGIWDGEYRLLYPGGSVRIQCYYKNGKVHGPSLFFSEDGIVLVETWFIEGKRTGKSFHRYLSGAKQSTQNYLDGVWHGKQIFWYENGNEKTVMEYVHGKVDGKVYLYYPNGRLKRELTFKEGKCIEHTNV